MTMSIEIDKRIAPRPWTVVKIGESDIHQPVMVIRDANGHAVAEYLAYGDALLIVECVNKGVQGCATSKT